MKTYLKNLEELLIEECCHTVDDSQAFRKLHELVEKDEPRPLDKGKCSRCRITIPPLLVATNCPNCGQRIKRWK